ncbi:substrate-binding domain-containing protein [Stappia sp. ES.058]|uniref:substrate-binding domain-containing protein n=1 Tax=Stappia sp. ES.058 TaxID=1881061 RepID=UPI000879D1B7|nr:substrate-binding domain-containing protein [Stappia sp. ES.058]SDU46647.1 monosaccharide ABC transporter substrate-binding protein, CUT2 family [Stappia sp. ES.058]
MTIKIICDPKHLFLPLLLLPLVLFGEAVADETTSGDYWTLREFHELHPREAIVAKRFAKRVAEPAEEQPSAFSRPLRIVVIYPGVQASDYWRRSVVSLQSRLQEIGVPHEIDSHFTRPGNEIRQQARLIAEALTRDPDYLVFTLDAFRHRVIVEQLISGRGPKVILQNITTPLRSWRKAQPFFYVGFDHSEGTRLLIDHILGEENADLQDFAILYGPPGYVSSARGDSFRMALAKRPEKNLAASYYVGFNREKARSATLSLLASNPEVDFIYSCSTDIALGVIDAIDSLGLRGKVRTNGWGGGGQELEEIAKGRLAFTVMRMNDDNGVAMAEAIALDQQDRPGDVPLVYSGEFTLVTQDHDTERIEALKRHAFRYSQ